MSSHGFVGDLLIRAGVVDAAGLALGLEAQSRQATTLGLALAGLGLAEESAVAAAIASALHLAYLDGELPYVPEAVAALLPVAFCRKHGVAPLGFDGNVLRVAVTDPMDYSALQDVEFRAGKKAVAVVVTETWLEKLVLQLYPEADRAAATYDMLDTVKPAGEVEAAPEGEYDLVDPAALAKDFKLPPVVKLVNLILSQRGWWWIAPRAIPSGLRTGGSCITRPRARTHWFVTDEPRVGRPITRHDSGVRLHHGCCTLARGSAS